MRAAPLLQPCTTLLGTLLQRIAQYASFSPCIPYALRHAEARLPLSRCTKRHDQVLNDPSSGLDI